jgi:hypothetical protein
MAEFAADMGVSPNTAAGWYRRYSVPSKYWELLLAKASERKVKVTAKDLVALASKAA